MTTDEFAIITQRVIARDGFDEFQPTACYPARREVKVLAGFPPHVDPEAPVLEWAAKSAILEEEFLVAFKSGLNQFTIIRCLRGVTNSKDYAVS
jgi:hypothetical protein